MSEQNNKVSSVPETTLNLTPFDPTRVLESIDDACYVLDSEWRFVYLNTTAEQLVRRTRQELIGRSIWDEFPEAEQAGFGREYRRAVAERVPITLEEFYPPLDTWFAAKAFPFEGGLSVFFQDVDARKRAEREAEREMLEGDARLRDTQVLLDAALSAGGIATWTYDLTIDRVVADTRLARLFSVSPEDAAGGRLEVYLQAIHPEDRPRVAETIADAVAHKDVYEAEYRVVLPDGSLRWLATRGRVERDTSGQAVSLPGVVLDITEQVARREREQFLIDFAERARGTTDPAVVIADAVTSLGEFLGAYRCVFADIDIEADTCTVSPDYRADASVVSIVGTFPISAFGAFVVAEYKAGRTAIVDDVRADPVKAPPESLPAYEAIGVRAYVAAPVMHSARLVSAIAVHSALPRQWKPEEVELMQTVVERAWLIVEVLRQQEALARSADEQHARAEREALVSRIGQALLATTDPAVIQGRAATLLGEALGADRCYVSLWDAMGDRILVHEDYHRADLPSVAGSYSASQYAPVMDMLFARGTAVVPDVRASELPDAVIAMMLGFELKSVLSVPFFDGDGQITAALMVAMTEGPRQWTPEEVSLVEAAAALTRTAVETARLHQREHRIAEQLARALQPPIPTSVPGMGLAEFYRPAWEDQGVGGDFSDVFSTDKGMTYLIVGDLSGKGLAAASQVASVRHMLRFALLNGETVAGPVSVLNRTLADYGLITGFATLFVGRYDAQEKALTYVNCGQDAGLILRAATGNIDPLPPTGPVLGAASEAIFTEESVTLDQSDVLALYTDGLTEAGPTRTALLTGDGVADLLRGTRGITDPQTIISRLMAGVDAHAGRGVRDDQCLLVGLVSG